MAACHPVHDGQSQAGATGAAALELQADVAHLKGLALLGEKA